MVAHRPHLPLIQHALRVWVALLVAATAVAAQGAAPVKRGTVRTESMWSQALGVRKQLVVYLPPSYADADTPARRYPVAVYLHGAWGGETDWTTQGHLAGTMDSLVATGMPEMIVVMPDGDDGWWTTWHGLNDVAACRRASRKESADTYCVPWPKYDDYVVHDVVAFTDSAFRTMPQRESRGIAGLSMGGYGAITIAVRNPGTFSVAASHSGVLRPALLVDSSTVASTGVATVRDAFTADELRAVSGGRWSIIAPAFGSDSVSWMARDPLRLVERMIAQGDVPPSMLVDVGRQDVLLGMNRSFRDRLAELRVPLLYAEWEGGHDWMYWRAHLPESLRFLADRLAPAQ